MRTEKTRAPGKLSKYSRTVSTSLALSSYGDVIHETGALHFVSRR